MCSSWLWILPSSLSPVTPKAIVHACSWVKSSVCAVLSSATSLCIWHTWAKWETKIPGSERTLPQVSSGHCTTSPKGEFGRGRGALAFQRWGPKMLTCNHRIILHSQELPHQKLIALLWGNTESQVALLHSKGKGGPQRCCTKRSSCFLQCISLINGGLSSYFVYHYNFLAVVLTTLIHFGDDPTTSHWLEYTTWWLQYQEQ